MNTQLRTQILEFLTPLPALQTEEARQATVYAAGVHTALQHTDLSGSPANAITAIVNSLEQYGAVDEEPALVPFLRHVATTVGPDKRQRIDTIWQQLLRDYQERSTTDMPPKGSSPISDAIGPNPYKGLAAFQDTDAERFFGRERVTQTLYESFCALRERPLDGPAQLRLLAILGPSGSGKSSVARAGLLPKLARSSPAHIAVVTPGVHPLEALATVLARYDDSPRTLAVKMDELNGILERQTAERHEGLRRIADTLPDIDTQPLILLIDQFEEVYSKDVKPDERRTFLDNLLCAAADASGHVSVILTLRSDFLGHTQQHPDVNQAIGRNSEIVTVMTEAELRDAIAKPAKQAGHALDAACVDLLIAQSRDREGALPLLQFALMRIWDGLAEGATPAETLKQIGGVGGALAGEAQRLFDQLSEVDQNIARRAFLALVQLGEGARDTRRRINLDEVVAHGEEPEHVQAVVRCFADPRARLVTLSAGTDGTETAEVTHEALLEHWATLREWLDSNREDVRFHRHLAATAEDWETQEKPDGKLWRSPDLELLQQYHHRAGADMTPGQVAFFEASVREARQAKLVRRMAVSALTVLTVLAIGAAGFAWVMYGRAKKQTDEALRLYHVSIVQSVINYADQYFYKGEREQAALLARQAFFLNTEYHAGIENQITETLRITLVLPEADIEELHKQVCQQARRNLTTEEWQTMVKHENIAYTPCLGLPDDGADTRILRLRSTPMTTPERQHLTLFVNENGYVKTYVDNRFIAQQDGKVIADEAIGLMWQQSGSKEQLLYEDALSYIERLNREQFAGFSDWRLPTVEELTSLVKPEEKNSDLYIDPIFDTTQSYCWSADLMQIKGEDSRESAWVVSFYGGHVRWNFFNYNNYVRAVRS